MYKSINYLGITMKDKESFSLFVLDIFAKLFIVGSFQFIILEKYLLINWYLQNESKVQDLYEK